MYLLFPVSASAPKIEYLAREEIPTILTIRGDSLMPIGGIIYEEIWGIVSAYNPVWQQTDSTPHITASGRKAVEGVIANNCLKFGTLVEIEGEVYVVADRMNSRYNCSHFDILMLDFGEAKEFGRRKLVVKVYK